MDELTDEQIKRQDFVDNAIHGLLSELNPSQKNVEWNIEAIGEIRDLICYWLVECMRITDEKSFYPCITIDS